jgi:hypothetical protein
MKQIFKIFFLLLIATGHAQEKVKKDSKMNLTKPQNLETSYLELRSPLNLVQCKNCISENPIIDLKELNDDSKFKQILENVIYLNSIAFNLIMDKAGRIIEFKPNYTYSYITKSVSESNFNKLSSLVMDKRILDVSNTNTVGYYKTTLSFSVTNNQIILNSILH